MAIRLRNLLLGRRFHRDYHARPLVLLKLAICRLGLAGVVGLVEFCHRCGHRVRDVWWAHPELWREVVCAGDAGVRCLRCFDAECRERGKFISWAPLVTHRRDPQGRWTEVGPPDPEFYPVAARLYAEERAR